MKKFDFSVTGLLEFSDIGAEEKLKLLDLYDDLWDELVAKCPEILQITEIKPVKLGFNLLNQKALSFSKLLSLETNSSINNGFY